MNSEQRESDIIRLYLSGWQTGADGDEPSVTRDAIYWLGFKDGAAARVLGTPLSKGVRYMSGWADGAVGICARAVPPDCLAGHKSGIAAYEKAKDNALARCREEEVC